MKVTIKVEEAVPYTMVVVVSEAQLVVEEIDACRVDVVGKTLATLRAEVGRRVEEEMQSRGIKLGDDGLRVVPPNADIRDRAT